MIRGRRAISRWWLVVSLALAGWGAVVPDGSVVQSEDQAPRVPIVSGPAKKQPSTSATPKPKPDRVPEGNPSPRPRPGRPKPDNSGAAFGGSPAGDTDNPGETRPLVPLAPAPVSTASTMPLWAALAVFLFLAVGGFWLAQQRNQD